MSVLEYSSFIVHVITYNTSLESFDVQPGDYCVRLASNGGDPTVYLSTQQFGWQGRATRHPLASAIKRGQLSEPGTRLVVVANE